MNASIVLASSSPRRRELLASVGIPFVVESSRTPEEVLPGETPEAHVLRLSAEKALEVSQRAPELGRWYIGSDTVVVRDGEILGKPRDREHAAGMLRSLSGRSHWVLSGYAVHDRHGGQTHTGFGRTRVIFRELTEEQIQGYLDTGEPFDKAGSYAIQGTGAFMVRAIEGSYTTVVGLPLCELVELLERLGAARLFHALES